MRSMKVYFIHETLTQGNARATWHSEVEHVPAVGDEVYLPRAGENGTDAVWVVIRRKWTGGSPGLPASAVELTMADLPTTDAAALSRLLFDAREAVEMLADIISQRSSTAENSFRRLVAEIDTYRTSRGWSPDGFGGES